MKRIAIFAFVTMSAAAAHADPVTVLVPKAGATIEEKAAYVQRVDDAVKDVCRDEAAPIIGLSFWTYLSCVKHTREAVASKDPTGLYASREVTGGTIIAAK